QHAMDCHLPPTSAFASCSHPVLALLRTVLSGGTCPYLAALYDSEVTIDGRSRTTSWVLTVLLGRYAIIYRRSGMWQRRGRYHCLSGNQGTRAHSAQSI